MPTHSTILAWKILWTEELGSLQSMGLQRFRYNWATEYTTGLSPSSRAARGRVNSAWSPWTGCCGASMVPLWKSGKTKQILSGKALSLAWPSEKLCWPLSFLPSGVPCPMAVSLQIPSDDRQLPIYLTSIGPAQASLCSLFHIQRWCVQWGYYAL